MSKPAARSSGLCNARITVEIEPAEGASHPQRLVSNVHLTSITLEHAHDIAEAGHGLLGNLHELARKHV